MATGPQVVITLDLNPGTAEVRLAMDGTATVRLRAVMVAGNDITGTVKFDTQATVVSNGVEDSFVYVPLHAHVVSAAENRARACLQRARKETARVLAAHSRIARETR